MWGSKTALANGVSHHMIKPRLENNSHITLVSTTCVGKINREIPLGILYIASVLEKEGIEVNVEDFQLHDEASPYNVSLLTTLLEKVRGLVGISCFADTLPLVIAATKRAKEKDPGKLIILGGPGPTGVADEIVKHFSWIDIIVKGEGEETIKEVLTGIRNNCLDNISGISYRDADRIFSTPMRTRIDLSEDWPLPAYHLLDWNCYGRARVVTSRGCPYKCIFCDASPFWQRKTVFRNIYDVVSEIQYVKETFSIDRFDFADDTLVLERERILTLCNLLSRENLGIKWTCYGRVDLMDEYLMNEMAKAGCTGIFYGLESGSDHVLSRLRRGYNAEFGERIALLSCKYFGVSVSFIVGFPFESYDDFHQTIRSASKLAGNENMMVRLGPVMALPLSSLFSYYKNYLVLIPPTCSPFGLDMTHNVKHNVDYEELARLVQTYPSVFSGYYTFDSPQLQLKLDLLMNGEKVYHNFVGQALLDKEFGKLIFQTRGNLPYSEGTRAKIKEQIGLIHFSYLVRRILRDNCRYQFESIATAWRSYIFGGDQCV